MKYKFLKILFSFTVAIGAASILMISLGYAASIAVDTFNDGDGLGGYSNVCDSSSIDGCQYIIPFPPFSYVVPNTSTIDIASGVLGGERDIIVTHTNGTGNVNIYVNQGGSQRLDLNQDTATGGNGQLQWDGNDNSIALDTTGLAGVDLTDSGTNDGFQILIYSGDAAFDLRMSIYTGTNYSTYTLSLNNDISPPGQSFFIPFNDFSVAGGTGAVFTSTGAVVFDILPTATDVDLGIDLFEATANTDWGDLPDSYSATIGTDSGANHVVGSLYLGDTIDREADGIESAVADGDNTQGLDDEDGIVIPTSANNFGDGSADFLYTPNGATRGCLVGWIDWNSDGVFDATTSGTNNASELVMNISIPAAQMGSELTATITSPLYAAGGYEYPPQLFARFRLFEPFDPFFNTGPGTVDPTGCPLESGLGTALPTLIFGQAGDGEVEDYRIQFSNPTAVNLQTFSADNNATTLPVVGIAIVAVLALVSAGIFIVRRDQKQA